MNNAAHWENVYRSKAADAVSWYSPHLDTSLKLIRELAPDPATAIIDVGGGAATLVDDLLAAGYRDLSVLDISTGALAATQKRLGAAATRVQWLSGDVTTVSLAAARYDLWHDRAVFHFLTAEEQRRAYVRQVARTVRHGGHVIVATFGPQGPQKCSGLDVVRYDADGLHEEFGAAFRLLGSRTEEHQTPFGTQQQFLFCYCRVE